MKNWINKISTILFPVNLIDPGVYHYQTPTNAENQFRLHLRVDPDHRGVLIINAATILHLNETATEYAYHLVKGQPPDAAAKLVAKRYQISEHEARNDFLEFKNKVFTLLEVPDLDPSSYLDMSREDPYSGAASSPYRLDCALTYRLSDQPSSELAPTKRVDRELTTEEWTKIINRAWQAGIPQIIFTGGEPTLREDLVELIYLAEKNGQVTGLLTNGQRFKDTEYRQQILNSGLDHLLFTISPLDQESWKALKLILEEDLFTTVHLTITPDLVADLPQLIGRFRELGANAVSLSTSDPKDPLLAKALDTAQNLVAEADLPLKWDLPVPYSKHNPISLELDHNQQLSHGAGRAWFYVEPDGDVLPGQGINEVLGNLLADDWAKIWK